MGTTAPKGLISQAAADLRMLGKDGRTISTDTQDVIDFLIDRIVHDIPWPKERLIEQFFNQKSGGIDAA